jgi:hypothetical protein
VVGNKYHCSEDSNGAIRQHDSTIVRGETNFYQNVMDSNLPGISLIGQDMFNVCNNCIFHGNNLN